MHKEVIPASKKNIIFVNFYDDPYLIQIVESLEQSFNVHNFSLFQHDSKQSTSILDLHKLFPSSILQSLQDENLSITSTLLSKDFLAQFISTLDRVCLIKLNGREILAYYRNLITYFEMYFRKHGIDAKNSAIVFDSTPHMPWDVVLYALAKNQRIKTIIPKNTNLPQTIQFYYDIDFNETVNFQENEDFLVTPSMIEFNKFAPDLINLQVRIKSLQAIPIWRQKSFGLLLLLKCTKMFVMNNRELSYFRMQRNQLFRIVLSFYSNTKKSQKIMRKLSRKKPNLEKPYVFFALHAQPERTTDPEAGIFSNQFLAIKKLSSLIPKNWEIIVKEHPLQFDIRYLHLKQLHFRNPNFYELIQSIPNVQIVSENFSSDMLISKSQAVATGTGSVAWEAILKGKHAITFGNTWLSGHPMCITANDLSKNKELSFANSDVFNTHREFFLTISKTLINSCNSKYTLSENKSAQQMVLNFSKAIIAAL